MLTTIKRYKRLMGLPEDVFSEDGTLTMLIAAASSAIEARCRRLFAYGTWTEVVDGVSGNYILLSNYPIHSVETISSGDKELDAYQVDHQRGMLYRSCGWPCHERSIVVTYTAGYTLPSDDPQDPESDLPASLEHACVLLVPHLQRTAGVTAERVGDISVSYESGSVDLPSAVCALIRPYERPL